MYSKFNCTDLTSNFTPDLTGSCTDMTANFGSNDMTSDFYSSADANSTSNLDNLRLQLEKATADLDVQNKIYADNKAYWDACKYKSPAFKRAGFYHNDNYADSQCKAAREKMNAAATKIAQLKTQIQTLSTAIEKATAAIVATDPKLIAAKAEADAKAAQAKAAADAALKQSEAIGAATASRTKIIGYSIAGVILIAGIVWAVTKFRKK